MPDDVVARLRGSDGGYFMRQMFTEAADEIERLRQLVSETDKLRQERDSARLHVCSLRHVIGQGRTMDDYAREYGWELPKEEEDEQ